MSADVDLARRAAAGDPEARKAVSRIAHPIIAHRNEIFCIRYCGDNRRNYACTIKADWGRREKAAPLCEWGNASYAWMLEDLTGSRRLMRFEGRGDASLEGYLRKIANSRPFYERWKDWRFGRRLRAPSYIQALHPKAARFFLKMRDAHDIPAVAQGLGLSEAEGQALADRIVDELIVRNRFRLLVPDRQVSLTGMGSGPKDDDDAEAQGDLPGEAPDPATEELAALVRAGMKKLDGPERFVLQAMVVEGQTAKWVLRAFRILGVSIIEGVPPEETTEQQVFHFKRQALKKLARVSGLIE